MEWFINVRELADNIAVNEDHLDAMSLAEALLKVQEYIDLEEAEYTKEYDKKSGKIEAFIISGKKWVILLFNSKRQGRYLAELRAGFNNLRLVPDVS